MPNVIARDNGAGALTFGGASVATVSGVSVLISEPDQSVVWPVPHYEQIAIGTEEAEGGTITKYRMVQTGVDDIATLMRAPANVQVTARYRPNTPGTSVQEVVTLSQINLDLTNGYAEKIVRGSVRFAFGASVYTNTAGAVYRDPSPATGAGAVAGSLDPSTGRVALTSWTAGGANVVTLQAMLTEVGGQPVDDLVFRTPISPIKPGVLQLSYQLADGTAISKTPDSSGLLEDADIKMSVDFDRGVVRARFGRYLAVADLAPEQMAEAWYSPDAHVMVDGVESVWRPKLVLAESVVYNAVATTMLPPDSDLLGLDAARMPPDGKVLIFQTGQLCLVHHTAALAPQTLSAGQTIDCGRTRLYRVVIEDAAGLRVPADLYTVNRELGTLTLADPLDLTGYTSPYTVRHTIADLARLRDTDINGNLTFLRPMTHAFPTGSYVSGMLYIGTLQARVSNKFEQGTWTGEWSDALIGDAPLASYNDAAYPIAVTNAGAYQDRILVNFTSSTAFQVIGEQLGLIGIGDVNQDCAPINALTGQAYFTIDYRGWGGGWATGNCLRFNLHAASYPVDLVRATQPSDPTGVSDSVELLLVGNVDA